MSVLERKGRMIMTENEAIDLDKLIEDAKVLAKEKDTLARTFRNFKDYGNPKSTITSGAEKAQKEAEQYEHISKLFEELKAYRAIGTIDQINEVIHFLDLENDNGLINDMTLLNQYRAIGTVEQLEWCKDASHWKELFKEKLEQYEAIGTIEEFKALKEKSMARKPLPKGTHKGIDNFYCPNCNHPLTNRHEQCELPYCDICGQRLDWSE